MTTPYRKSTQPAAPAHHGADERHLLDYVRTVYKRRWIAIPLFLLVFVFGSLNAARQTPIYRARTQLMIEKDTPSVATLDQMFQAQDGWYNDEFYQTQYRILQSRSLAKKTIDGMRLWDAPRLGNGPEPRAPLSMTGLARTALAKAITLAKSPFKGRT